MTERMEKLKSYLVNSPHDSFLKHALALEYIKVGQDLDAKQLFEDILQSDPGYIGSYYHLGKLLVRTGEPVSAIAWYEKGLNASKAAGDMHAHNELRGALDELADL